MHKKGTVSFSLRNMLIISYSTYASGSSQTASILSKVETLLHLLSANVIFKSNVSGRILFSLMVSRATNAAEADVAPIRTSESEINAVFRL